MTTGEKVAFSGQKPDHLAKKLAKLTFDAAHAMTHVRVGNDGFRFYPISTILETSL